MDNQYSVAQGCMKASTGEKVKCVCLYTSLDSGMSRGGVISGMLMLHKSLVDLFIINVSPF